jgi:phosphate transport system substrate-binding protein
MRKMRYVIVALAAGVIAAVAFAAVAGAQPARKQADSLSGAGSSFVAPLVGVWQQAYNKATITYNPIGSGGGIQQITARTVDFGASDAPLSSQQFNACNGCVQLPWALSATAVLYNLPGVKNNLHLSGKVIADMFLGNITKWNDPKIQKLNKGVNLPDTDIQPVYRSDASGTTYNFTDFLQDSSSAFKSKVGHGTLVSWPKGVGARGSSGVAGVVSRTNGGLGYADIAYALKNKLSFAAVQNKSGKYALPGLRGIKAASLSQKKPTPANALSIVNPPRGKQFVNAYPICTYTYIILPLQTAKADALKAFVTWAVSDSSQAMGKRLLFYPIPAAVKARITSQLKRVHT